MEKSSTLIRLKRALFRQSNARGLVALFTCIIILLTIIDDHQSQALSISPSQKTTTTNFNNKQQIVKTSETNANNITNLSNDSSKSKTNLSSNDEQWNFVMEEYDLMDYLQNLSAKYKDINLSASPPEFPSSIDVNSDFSTQLEAKQNNQEQKVAILNSDDHQLTGKQTYPSSISNNIKNEQGSQQQISNKKSLPVTLQPELLATSLASVPLGDHEIGESSWQYGIFDRFTRPRSTTTTPDPKYTLDPHSKLDTRHYNTDECGLRTYDPLTDQLLGDRQFLASLGAHQFPVSPIISQEPSMIPSSSSILSSSSIIGTPGSSSVVSADDGPIKELSHRRQRPASILNGNPTIGDLTRWQQMEAIYNLNRNKFLQQQQQQYDNPSASSPSSSSASSSDNKQIGITNWPNKDEKDNYDSYKDYMNAIEQHQQQQQQSSPASSAGSGSANNDEFNLLARRNWLQQQLGNTLQMFANFNSTTMDQLFNSSSQTGNTNSTLQQQLQQQANLTVVALRENMMRKFGNLRSARSNDGTGTTNQHQQQPDKHSMLINDAIDELKARQDELKLEPRVIGGNDARLGDSPWSVSLQALVSRPGTGQVEYRHYCGGTIISEHYILTAAHCLDFMVGRESRLFVVIGDLNWRMSAASQFGRRFGIDRLIIHSGYKNTAFGHDIGLIRTKEPMKPLKVNGRYIINSVCLPEKGVEHTGEAELVGWGLFSNRNEMADSLQIAEVPILPRPLCVDLYRRRTGLIQWLIGIELITEKQVCAGTFGRGICQGDSGSALVFNEKTSGSSSTSGGGGNVPGPTSAISQILSGSPISRRHADDSRATIIGVVAFGGIRRCSYQSLPGVYMQTSKYMDWILPRIQA